MIQERCRQRTVLIASFILAAFFSPQPRAQQNTNLTVTIPIKKDRRYYYRTHEDGTGVVCGVRLYGVWEVYKNYTNLSSYSSWRGALVGIQNPSSPTLVIDGNRKYFQVYCYFNGTDSPRNDPPCNHTIGEQHPDWEIRLTRTPPRASFTTTFFPSTPGEVKFQSTSVDPEDPEGNALRPAWEFGDGGTGSTDIQIHRYTKPGRFNAKLTVTNPDGLFGAATREVRIPAPRAIVSMQLFNRHSRNRIEPEEEFRVRVTVEASTDGVGSLTNLVFNGSPLFVPNIFRVLSGPTETNIGSLQPGQKKEFDWTLGTVGVGNFTLVSASVTGRDEAGQSVFGSAASQRGEVTSLIVGVEQKPARVILGYDNNADGDTNELDHLVEIIVAVTNVTKQPITEVKAVIVNDPIQLTSIGQDLNIWLTPVNVPPGDFGTVLPGAENAVYKTNKYEATDRTYATASTLLQGKAGDAGVQVRGEGTIKVGGEILLEARFDLEDRPYKAGQLVRVFGSLKNVSRFKSNRGEILDEGKTIGVVVYPITEGNGTGGYLVKSGFGGRTPDSPTTFLLAPDEEQEIAAILPTAETPQETSLKLTYAIHVFIHGEDPKPRRADPTAIDIVEKDGWSARHTVQLIPVPEIKDPWLVCPTDLSFAGFVSCRFTEGLGNLGGSMADLGLLVGSGLKEIAVASWKWHSWKNWATRQVILGLLGDKAALERMATELAIDLQALKEVGAESLQGVTIAAGEILPALERNFIHTMQTLESGDLKQITGGLARITGENIDMPLEALVAARSARKALLVNEAAESIAKQALKESFEKQASQLARNVDEFAARQSIQDLPTSDVLPVGMDVLKHPRIWRDAYGALQQNIDDLLQIAKDEGVLLAFRSRSPKALEAIKKGLAILKPGGVSIKTVSEIDVKYLGYPGKYEGTCVLVSPPFDWHPRGFDRDLAVEKYLDGIPELNGNGPDITDLREQVRQRLHFQLDEWPKQLKNFRKYQKQGIDVNFNAKRQNLPEEKMPDNSSFRNARLKREVIEGNPQRRVYVLEMEDEYTGSGIFRPIAGDIDLLGIFKPDGSLPDLDARLRIYEKLRAVGAQHGESFTYYMEDLREKFLRCCSPPPFGENEKMLTATPDGKLLTTLYRDELSVVKGGVNDALKVGEGEFAFLAGALTELDSAPRVGTPAVLPPANVTYEGVEIRAVAHLARITDDIDAVIDRKDGKLVRVGPDGQPEVYVPPGAPTPPANTPLLGHTPGQLRQAAQDPSVEAALDAELGSLITAGYSNDRPVTRAGASGGQWLPVSKSDILSGPNGAMVKVAPYTYTSLEVSAGTNVVPIFSPSQMGVAGLSQFFAVGDTVVLDPGGPTEEIVTVASVSPFALSQPLMRAKKLGTMVLFLSGVNDPAGGPSSLPAQNNLLVWLKADAGVQLSPTNVISWTDQSPNGFVFAARNEAARPTLLAAGNGLSALRFDPVQRDQLHGNLGQTLSNATIFTLMRVNPQVSSTGYIYAFGTRNISGYMMTLARQSGEVAYHYDGGAEWANAGTWKDTNFVVLSQTYGGSGHDHHRLDLNGKTVIDSRTATGRPYSAVATNVVIGNYLSATYNFSGDLAEWIVYDRALTAPETSQVEEYLRRRAGLPPFPAETNVSLSSVAFSIGATDGEAASWTYNPTNGVFHADGGAAPSVSVLDQAFMGEAVHTRVTGSGTSGAIGVLLGYEDRGNFHLLDWRAVSQTNSVGEIAPAGLRLIQFHMPPDVEAPRFNDFYASTNSERTTVLTTSELTWIPDRIYDVFLRSSVTGLSIEIFDGTTQLVFWHLPEWTGPVAWFGHYSHGVEAAEFGPVTISEAPLEEPVLISISRGAGGGQWALQWSGGPGPFLLEKTADLDSGVWQPVGTPDSSSSRIISAENQGGFFRVRRITFP